MSESALLSRLAALERSRDSLDAWVKLWIALVVIGVIVEIVPVVVEYLKERKEYLRAHIPRPHPPHKPSVWLFSCECIGIFFVAVGVAGELCGHVKDVVLETKIRTIEGGPAS
jgi:hypothetical protein